MICIVLAGGFGTRINNIIGNRPKGLITVDGSSLVSRISREVDRITSVDSIILVSNSLHFEQYMKWQRCVTNECRTDITILDNGVTSVEQRLGAVGDLEFAIRTANLSAPVLVAAADCYFDFSLEDMCSSFEAHGGNWIATMYERDPSVLVHGAEVEVDDASTVVHMKEKPVKPRSNLGALPFYIFERTTLPLVPEFLRSGQNPDSPGRFAEWLYKKRKLSAFVVDGSFTCEDLGTPESYFNRVGN